MTAATTKRGVLWGVGACATGRCDGGFLGTPLLQEGRQGCAGPHEPELERQPLRVSHVLEPRRTQRNVFFVSMYGSYLLFSPISNMCLSTHLSSWWGHAGS